MEPVTAARQFQRSFTAAYGEQHPHFVELGWQVHTSSGRDTPPKDCIQDSSRGCPWRSSVRANTVRMSVLAQRSPRPHTSELSTSSWAPAPNSWAHLDGPFLRGRSTECRQDNFRLFFQHRHSLRPSAMILHPVCLPIETWFSPPHQVRQLASKWKFAGPYAPQALCRLSPDPNAKPDPERQEAALAAHRQYRFLLVYLHSPAHENTARFCTETLCDAALTDHVQRNYVAWGGDVRRTDAFRVRSATQRGGLRSNRGDGRLCGETCAATRLLCRRTLFSFPSRT